MTVESTRPTRARAVSGKKSGTASRPLDVAEILRVARKLVAEHGLDALSMRALTRELGVSHMATYHHVGNKEDLVALIVDDVLKQIEVPGPDEGSWEDRLRELNHRSFLVMRSCPGIDQAVFDTRPTTQGWRLIDAYVGILLEAGFTERQAALGFSLIHSYGMGRSGIERELRNSSGRVVTPGESSALQQIQPVWGELHRPDFRDFAIDVIIAGLRVILDTATPEAAE
ncbi:MAG: putative transcriptional regulator of the TetR family [Frankiales bacterium]|nr:putative transcriptional regulator of the TetR family [Frankiales bacterium]